MKWILYIIIACFLSGCSRQSFDSEKWKNWKDTESTLFVRRDMVEDLTKQYKLVGMSRSEINDLLGKPNAVNNRSIGYDLGPTGQGTDYGWLILTLDDNEVVKRFKITEH